MRRGTKIILFCLFVTLITSMTSYEAAPQIIRKLKQMEDDMNPDKKPKTLKDPYGITDDTLEFYQKMWQETKREEAYEKIGENMHLGVDDMRKATNELTKATGSAGTDKESLSRSMDYFMGSANNMMIAVNGALKFYPDNPPISPDLINSAREEISRMKDELDKINLSSALVNESMSELCSKTTGVLDKVDNALEAIQLVKAEKLEPEQAIELAQKYVPIEAAPTLGMEGGLLKGIFKENLKGVNLAKEGLDILRDELDGKGEARNTYGRALSLQARAGDWGKNYGKNAFNELKESWLDKIPGLKKVYNFFAGK